MKQSTTRIFDQLFTAHPALSVCRDDIRSAFELLIECYSGNGKLLVCGNGGSAADSEHIVGELMKGFILQRKLPEEQQEFLHREAPEEAEFLIQSLQQALPAISLVSHTALMTAYANDKAADCIFAQQVLGYGLEGDVLLAISTSGNSANVLYALRVARMKKMKIIGLTGEAGGKMVNACDVTIRVPSNITYQIQEYHLPVYHCLCACVENEKFGEA